MTTCKHCGCTDTRIVKQIAANGSEQVFIQCLACGGNATGAFLRHPSNVAMLPVVADYRSAVPVCEVCGASGAEWHHFAPRYLFGDACDDWPGAWLCRQCHAQWHQTVTPDMGRTKHER